MIRTPTKSPCSRRLFEGSEVSSGLTAGPSDAQGSQTVNRDSPSCIPIKRAPAGVTKTAGHESSLNLEKKIPSKNTEKKSVVNANPATDSIPSKTSYSSKTEEAEAIYLHAMDEMKQSGNLKKTIKENVENDLRALFEIVKLLEQGHSKSGIGDSKESQKHAELDNKEDKSREILNEIREVKNILKSEAEKGMKIMKETKNAVNNIEAWCEAPKTYAQATAAMPTREPERENLHSIIVTSPNDTDTADKVVEKIRQAVKATTTGVQIDKIRKTKNQTVVISCKEKLEMERVRTKITEASAELNVTEAKNKWPLVVVKDVMKYLSDEEITAAIVNQNGSILQGIQVQESDLKLKYRRKARNHLQCHVVLQVAPQIWKRLTEAGLIHVDLQRVIVEDQSPLIQCTKCLGFGHGRRFCKEPEEDICSHCGGPHLRADCQALLRNEKPECRNCKIGKKECSHNAFDKNCPTRKKWEEVARRAVAYC